MTAARNSLLLRPQGLTLIEMVLTLLVTGILVALGTPMVSRTAAHGRVNHTANVVAADLEFAFSVANRQRRPVRISVTSELLKYTITDRATAAVLRHRTLGSSSDLHVASLRSTVSSLVVFPNGLASNAIAMTLTDAGYSKTITMTRTGQVRISP